MATEATQYAVNWYRNLLYMWRYRNLELDDRETLFYVIFWLEIWCCATNIILERHARKGVNERRKIVGAQRQVQIKFISFNYTRVGSECAYIRIMSFLCDTISMTSPLLSSVTWTWNFAFLLVFTKSSHINATDLLLKDKRRAFFFVLVCALDFRG